MKFIILISAVLALATAAVEDSIGEKIRRMLHGLAELPKEKPVSNVPSAQNIPPPLPPDFGDIEVMLGSDVTTEVEWIDEYGDTESDEYLQLKAQIEEEVSDGIGENFTHTVTNLEVTGFSESAEIIDPSVAATFAIAAVDITFVGVLGDADSESEFCLDYRDLLGSIGGEERGDCTTTLQESRQTVCDTDDGCPPAYKCELVEDGSSAECLHPCFIEERDNPEFSCSGDGQVCYLNTTLPGIDPVIECRCDAKYLDSGGSCVHQNTIIIPTSVVGGVLFLAIIIAAAVLASKIAAKERREKDGRYLSSSDGEFLDETLFESKKYRRDEDGDSGIAGPGKNGVHEEDPVYRGFDDVVDTMDEKPSQNGGVQQNGVVLASRQNDEPEIKKDQPSVRDYNPLNARQQREENNRDYEPFDRTGQDNDYDRPGYAKVEDLNTGRNGYEAPPPRQTNRQEYPEDKDALYSPLRKNSAASNRNRVLREPDTRYTRGNPNYDEPRNNPRVSRRSQNDSPPYDRGGGYGTASRGYDRPPRNPGIPERRYSRNVDNDTDRNLGRTYDTNDPNSYIPQQGTSRYGIREASMEVNGNSYRNNWDIM